MSLIYVTTDGDTLWVKCFADDPDADDGEIITLVEPGSKWDDLAAAVAGHQAAHACGTED